MTHHPFSPSVLGRRLLCPGSYRMEMAAPERESEDAARGTRLHEEMARPRGEWETTDEEERALLERCWAEVDRRIDVREYKLYPEYFERLYDMGEIELTNGTCDLVAATPPGSLTERPFHYIFDWKFGHGEAPETFLSLQIQAYAAMVLQDASRSKSVKAVAFYPETGAAFEIELDRPGMLQVVRAIKAIRAACESPEALLRPGPEQCKYCRAAAGCPALETQIARVVEDPMPLTVEKRAKRREARLMIEKWCEAVQADDKEFVRAGGEIPGWRLGARNGREFVSEPEVVIARVAADLGPPVWDAVSVNLGELKRLWHLRHGGERKASDAALMTLIGAHVARSQGFEVLYRGKKEA